MNRRALRYCRTQHSRFEWLGEEPSAIDTRFVALQLELAGDVGIFINQVP